MTTNYALKTYQATNVKTADNLQLIIMCYDAAINDLEEARKSQQNHHIEATYDRIRHAQDIVTELLVGLDYERGGDIARNLSRIYNFVLRQLVGINTSEDIQTYDHLIRIMGELKDAWKQLRAQHGSSAMPASAQPPGAAWQG